MPTLSDAAQSSSVTQGSTVASGLGAQLLCSEGKLGPDHTVCCAGGCHVCGGSKCPKPECCMGRIRKTGKICKIATDVACILPSRKGTAYAPGSPYVQGANRTQRYSAQVRSQRRYSSHVKRASKACDDVKNKQLLPEQGAPIVSFAITATDESKNLHLLDYMWQHVVNAGNHATIYTGQPPESPKHEARAPWQPAYHSAYGLNHVRLEDVSDFAYPPLEKNFAAWHHLISKSTIRAEWYARCDQDTFVDPRRLRNVLHDFGTGPTYTGREGWGRPVDVQRFNITFPYALGGTCEFLSSAAAHIIWKELPKCLVWSQGAYAAMSDTHSDVEFGRCLFRHGIHFSPSGDSLAFRSIGKMRKTGPLTSLEVKDLLSNVCDRSNRKSFLTLGPSGIEPTFASLHPIKNADAALYLSNVAQGLTPIPALKPSTTEHAWDTPCAHNPTALAMLTACCNQDKKDHSEMDTPEKRLHTNAPRCMACKSDNCSLRVRECPPVTRWKAEHEGPGGAVLSSSHGVLATLNGLDARQVHAHRLATQLSLLMQRPAACPIHLLQAVRGAQAYSLGIDSLLPGELAHRETFRRAVIEAIDTNASSLLFFEEDVVPRVDFSERWDILRASPRCFGFLHHPGGVLLLGASEWSLPWAKEEL